MSTKIVLERARTAYGESLRRLAAEAKAVAARGPTIHEAALENELFIMEGCRAVFLKLHDADRAADLADLSEAK